VNARPNLMESEMDPKVPPIQEPPAEPQPPVEPPEPPPPVKDPPPEKARY